MEVTRRGLLRILGLSPVAAVFPALPETLIVRVAKAAPVVVTEAVALPEMLIECVMSVMTEPGGRDFWQIRRLDNGAIEVEEADAGEGESGDE